MSLLRKIRRQICSVGRLTVIRDHPLEQVHRSTAAGPRPARNNALRTEFEQNFQHPCPARYPVVPILLHSRITIHEGLFTYLRYYLRRGRRCISEDLEVS